MSPTPRPAPRALALLAAASVAGASLALPASAVAAPTDGAVAAAVTVPKIDGLSDDFIGGVDVSSVLSLEASGVVFRDATGAPGDLFEILADAGVSDVRVRVWNDPFDADGNGYGGGDVDVERAVEIGQRATAAGLGVLVDFHYSDFWADPAKQQSPKAWEGLSLDARAEALYDFTHDALDRFEAAAVDVEMVQVGNETNNGIAGVQVADADDWDAAATLFSAGSAAVRDAAPDALVALHFTNPETAGRYANIAKQLDDRDVDYDVFASSYYPFWHGSTENLTAVLSQIADDYGKKVLVAETSWASTLDDADGHGNVIDVPAEATRYPVSEQGQAWALSDVMAAVAAVGDAGLGVYYWEPAWLPVGPPAQLEANRTLWERDGSGWASSFAAEYDPEDAGEHFGGSAWDNQALFAPDGMPLDSLNTFSYVRTGSVAPLEVVAVQSVSLAVDDGDEVVLPDTVAVSYNDRTTRQEHVAWTPDTGPVAGPGTYAFTGLTESGEQTSATVTVRERNFLAGGGFEDDDLSVWRVSGTGVTLGGTENPRTGDHSTHFWLGSDYAFAIEQTVTGLPAGTYRASGAVQGDGEAAGDSIRITVSSGPGVETEATASASADFALDGYRVWSTPVTDAVEVGADGTATVRIDAQLSAGAWGSIDDVTLTRVAAVAADTTALEAAVARAEGIDRSAFTPASVAAVDEALGVARAVLAQLVPTPEATDAALDALDAALGSLVALGPAPSDGGTPVPAASDDPVAGGTATSGGAAPSGSSLSATGGTLPWAPVAIGAFLLAAGMVLLRLRTRSGRS
ncbi:glycosyl hydrolase 53 family protein [Microbacterium oleivorans]|uniref:glycosyl hydrolase 53 family protein n=1 Tax=Microbacterium oleivorans TaxID=273677 RepID=UPI001C4A5FC1|nr:glycosyl hydrolase 53 family protein [Microbacterium oleivorans]